MGLYDMARQNKQNSPILGSSSKNGCMIGILIVLRFISGIEVLGYYLRHMYYKAANFFLLFAKKFIYVLDNAVG